MSFQINGKAATCIRLFCALHQAGCPGFIEKDVLMYLLEGDEIYLYGKCGECNHSGNITISLMELLTQIPTGMVC
jgi:hypothetical protein